MSLASTAPGLISLSKGYSRASEVFGELGTVKTYLAFEAALAEVQGEVGVIPPEAVRTILAACRREDIDLDMLRNSAAGVGYPIVPLVLMLAQRAGPHGQWVHFGATTQDVMDTALVLQLRQVLLQTLAEVVELENVLAKLASSHCRTPMAGRSKLQHAVPISFGYKVAVWLDQIFRTRVSLVGAIEQASVLQLGGAAGTLSSLHPKGMEVRRKMAERLCLTEPDISWHVSRDRFVVLAGSVAALLASLGKMAMDVAHLMSTEVGELFEPAAEGRGTSSTMPQKRNPVICEAIVESARTTQHVPALILDAMLQEHERGIGHCYRERAALCDAVMQLSGAVTLTLELMSGIEVVEARMARNLGLTNGLIHTEALMIHLSDRIGRIEAHRVLHEVSHKVIEHGVELDDALREVADLDLPVDFLNTETEIEAAQNMIDRVLMAVAQDHRTGEAAETGTVHDVAPSI